MRLSADSEEERDAGRASGQRRIFAIVILENGSRASPGNSEGSPVSTEGSDEIKGHESGTQRS